MFDYLWWLLPSFLKKSLTKNSNLRGILNSAADSLTAVKISILKSRLAKFFIPAESSTDFNETDYPFFLQEHAKDRSLPGVDMNTLLIDPRMRTFLGTKEGMKYYLELLIPEIRVDFIYEIAADEMKWILFSKRDLLREAPFNRSVLLSKADRDLLEFMSNRKTRIYSKTDLNKPEFLFWVKVYDRIKEDGTFAVYPERIIAKIDRLKPAHVKGHLVFNYLDVQVTNISEGQVFIGETVNIEGNVVQSATA
jgi:hypothetical protein